MQPVLDNLSSESTTGNVGFEELAIALFANQFNPSILNLDFLKISGIIPGDWQLQGQPTITPNAAQAVFQNGVNLVFQNRTVSFLQIIDPTNTNPLKIPELARIFVERLPYSDYQGISIKPKILVGLPANQGLTRKYIVEKLLSPGPWCDIGIRPVQAAINFSYQLENCQLLLNLTEAQIQQAEKPPLPAVLFSGSFNYEVTSYSEGDRFQEIVKRLQNWSVDLEGFRDIVNNRFFGNYDNVFL
ncbi:hypothetical protein [Calothrix sp. PCC 7507]|uniref:hypothetical protein n=1 Tax=Calothrix sp. PCC 7507 TaxID=99598 RepID=UPI00029F1E3F|nr:hypothetical protein [Calothrix sp. PCC 7507]AFY32949.1 hypothetical protein Cal7507_2521 [Calothrix sp. PCC 7507]